MSFFMQTALAGLCTALLSVSVVEAAPQQAATSTAEKQPDERKVEFASPELARLDLFVGTWTLTETHFDDRGQVIATAKGTEEISWILDDRAIQRTYTSAADSKPFRAIGTLSWNDVEKTYHGYWLNNVSTAGPTRAKGEWNEETRTMVLTLEASGKDGQTLRHRVVERIDDEKQRVATTYQLRGSEVVKRVEVVYRRAVPCPGGPRLIPIMDELIDPKDK